MFGSMKTELLWSADFKGQALKAVTPAETAKGLCTAEKI